MADYHAVLQRTLSGFTDPKPELRAKLYERARATISRQLESRTPAVTGEALKAELDKLEKAIFEIERGYDPSYSGAKPEPAKAAEKPAPPARSRIGDSPSSARPAPARTSPGAPSPASSSRVLPRRDATAPLTTRTPASRPETATMATRDSVSSAADPAAEVASPVGAATSSAPVVSDVVESEATDSKTKTVSSRWKSLVQSLKPKGETVVPEASPPEPTEQVEEQPDQAGDLNFRRQPAFDPSLDPTYARYPQYRPVPPADEPVQSEATVEIPPSPGFGNGVTRRRRNLGFVKFLVLLLVLVALGGAGSYVWMNKETVFEQLGMSDLLDDPERPKPVRTIAITPEADSTAPAAESDSGSGKVESRLNADGQEVAQGSRIQTESQPVDLNPTSPTGTTGAPATAQSAILYEEGRTAEENSVDAGRVVWSVVQEAPAPGDAPEPAIRGRIEIPDRQLVLIMTLKRNADKALPASHLIELVFAVPNDFSGGSIGQISRFVLKQSEQERGEALIGVPARIADGIFLIALNNLEQARLTNESLLKTREWIDIPIEYSTGRRALITIEKGGPGTSVFEEVFSAWSGP